MNKTVTAFLSLLLFLAVSTTVQAQSGSGDGYDYSINASNADTITITNYTGPGGAVTIPTNINNLLVTGIGIGEDTVFSDSLISVTIPSSITSIGSFAFVCYSNLTSVSIGNGVTNIDDWTFADCPNLTNVMMPNGVTSIGNYAFAFCFNLSIAIPNSVTNIGKNAFSDCFSLTSITIPSSVTSIDEYAFVSCTSLASVYFEGNAPNVGSGLFEYCINQLTVYYLPGTTGWSNTFAYTPAVTAVLWNPLIQTGDGSFGVQSNQFGFNITNATNLTVVVEACTNLANPVWTPLQTLTLSNGSAYFSDPQWTNYPARFYGLGLP
jgi:hypothetical protein